MATNEKDDLAFALRGRWNVLNDVFGSRIRQSDASHTSRLTADERLSIVDDLLGAVFASHVARETWEAVDERAWERALAERRHMVAAFLRLDEVRRGLATPAHVD